MRITGAHFPDLIGGADSLRDVGGLLHPIRDAESFLECLWYLTGVDRRHNRSIRICSLLFFREELLQFAVFIDFSRFRSGVGLPGWLLEWKSICCGGFCGRC